MRCQYRGATGLGCSKIVRFIALGGLVAIVAVANVQSTTAEPKTDNQQKAVPITQGVSVPSSDVLTLIIRSAILSLNDALETGNFTVLRDRGSPAFQ